MEVMEPNNRRALLSALPSLLLLACALPPGVWLRPPRAGAPGSKRGAALPGRGRAPVLAPPRLSVPRHA